MGKKKKQPGMGTGSERITGVVRRLFHSSARFSAGVLATAEGDQVRFAGPVFFSEDDFVTLAGEWKVDEKWGRQFAVTGFEYAGGSGEPLDADGLAHYLAVSKDFKGLGPKKARILAERFGADFSGALEDRLDEVCTAAGIDRETGEKIREVWRKNSSLNGTMTWLARFGLTAHQINSIVDAYGNNTVKILTDDPYRMIEVIDGFGFSRVDEIAQKMGIAKNHPSRLQAGIRQEVSKALDDGHTWTERTEVVRLANILLALDDIDSMTQIEDQLDAMIRADALSEQPHPDPSIGWRLVALPVMARMERDICDWLAGAAEKHNPVLRKYGGRLEPKNPELNEDQRTAVRFALACQLVVITGGAGSGKTYTLKSIVDEFSGRGHNAIVLCAPTGKAARRITESVGRSAATIHRTLGYRGGDTWNFNRMNPLAADLVVVDEFSMVDVSLAWRLLQAIDWSRTAVVLVGDPNQLPPIGAGNVLRDVINSADVPVIRLNQVVRQAGELKHNSMAILSGEVPRPVRRRGDPPAPWYVMDKSEAGDISDAEHARDMLVAVVDERLEHLRSPDGIPFDLLRDVQILTPQHGGALGTRELNIALQRVLQRKLYGITVEPVEEGRRPRFLVGDKVIQTKNDYELGIMNGTIGYIQEIDCETGDLIVDFDGEDEPIVVPKKGSKQSHLAHAYALTVHKMQGSEVPCAIAITHKAHTFMQHQAMLYTAVTRAKQTAIVFGDAWGIRQAARTRKVETRRTFLALWLRQAPAVGSAAAAADPFALTSDSVGSLAAGAVA